MRSVIKGIVGALGIKPLLLNYRFQARGNKVLDRGQGNVIEHTQALVKGCEFEFFGNNNRVILGPEVSLIDCYFRFFGDNHLLQIGRYGSFVESRFMFEDHDCAIIIGEGTTMQRKSEISAVEPHSRVEIGNDCLFASWVDIRNTDSHSVIDLATGKRINFGKDIKIGNHVWLGNRVQVNKGVTIGDGAVVAMLSLVNKDVPANSVAAGMPAKVIKEGVTWVYDRIAADAQVTDIKPYHIPPHAL